MLTKQITAMENLGKYNEHWQKAYENKNINDMDKYYKKIKSTLKVLMPMENTIKVARKIENIHTVIKNNNNNFDISENELKLAEKLA